MPRRADAEPRADDKTQDAVVTAIVNGSGEVSLGDTVWPATGPDMETGAHVRVVSADGPVVKVEWM